MNFISCFRHPFQKIQFLYLLPEKIEILCDNCLEDSVIQPEIFNIKQLIHINTLLEKPETIYKKLNLESAFVERIYAFLNTNLLLINEKIKEIVKEAQNILKQIKNIMEEFKNSVKKIENLRKRLIKDMIKEVNYESLKQTLLNLVGPKNVKSTNADVIEQLKLKLHQYFTNLQKNNSNEVGLLITNKMLQTSKMVFLEIYKHQTFFNELFLKLNGFRENQKTIFAIIYPYRKLIQSNLLLQQFQLTIISKIGGEGIFSFNNYSQLIYLGSRDGLNAQSFWSKVNGKKNLLMIFKSKSNYIFGAYSPCQWQQNGGYVQDNTNSSFLFSQTHDEIYPIVDNGYAIYCNSTYGPTFGCGCDLVIKADFQDGYSYLGNSYKQGTKYQGEYSTQLFGQKTPNLIECEIFEITTK